ncbi:MAG: BPSL0761 family protein [Polaromonas sp.]
MSYAKVEPSSQPTIQSHNHAAERTRSLRWGWEFMLELQNAPELDETFRGRVVAILQHYPSPMEIRRWAVMEDMWESVLAEKDIHRWYFKELEPEKNSIGVQKSAEDDEFVRRAVSPAKRARALQLAWRLFVNLKSMTDLPEHLNRQIPYVLRHFPDEHEITGWAHRDAREAAGDAEFTAWLAPS